MFYDHGEKLLIVEKLLAEFTKGFHQCPLTTIKHFYVVNLDTDHLLKAMKQLKILHTLLLI